MKWERKKKRNYATQGNDIMTWNPRKSNNDEVKKVSKIIFIIFKRNNLKQNVKNETNREEQHLSSNFVQIPKFSGFQQQNDKGEY